MSKLKLFFWQLEKYFFEFWTKYFVRPTDIKPSKPGIEGNIVVSLTSYPPRFAKLHLTLKCLLSQSVKPDCLVLWVATEDYSKLPDQVISLEKKFEHFMIKCCEDLGAYKKIIPSLQAWPDSHIVTADDDVYYPRNWLKGLIKAVMTNPRQVSGYRVHEVKFDEQGNIKPYRNWKHNVFPAATSEVLFATGCGGVIYPPYSLHSDVVNIDLFMRVCPNADDIWLFWMARKAGTKVGNVGQRLNIVSWLGADETSLAGENYLNDRNDVMIKNMVSHFGHIAL